eukprot:7390186-Prymnesium_polylepis.1
MVWHRLTSEGSIGSAYVVRMRHISIAPTWCGIMLRPKSTDGSHVSASRVVTRGHAGSRGVTRGHAGSRVVTRGHAGSRGVTRGHAGPHGATRGHAGSHAVTWGRIGSREVMWDGRQKSQLTAGTCLAGGRDGRGGG